MRTALKACLLGLALTAGTVTARAEDVKNFPECTREPSDNDIAAAKAAFQAGNASFQEADYPRAILYWEDAYRRDCTAHALLLNLARAYELHGQKRQAVVALETYLARKPDAPDQAQITRRIEVLNSQIEAEAAAAPTSPSQPPAGTANTTPTPAPTSAELPPGEAGAGGPRSRPIAPLIVAGAGGAIAIVGGILYLGAASDVSEYEDRCEDRTCLSDADTEGANDARKQQQLFGAMTLAGLGIAAGGAIWYFVSGSPGEAAAAKTTRRAQLTPHFAPGFTGVSVSGAF